MQQSFGAPPSSLPQDPSRKSLSQLAQLSHSSRLLCLKVKPLFRGSQLLIMSQCMGTKTKALTSLWNIAEKPSQIQWFLRGKLRSVLNFISLTSFTAQTCFVHSFTGIPKSISQQVTCMTMTFPAENIPFKQQDLDFQWVLVEKKCLIMGHIGTMQLELFFIIWVMLDTQSDKLVPDQQ